MAGEPVLRSEIELNIAKYLDRKDDPVITDIVGTWFAMAHRKAQRLFNFSWMEGYDIVTPLEEGEDHYPASPLVKEAIEGYTLRNPEGVVKRYRKTDVDTWRRYSDDGYFREGVLAFYNNSYLLYPATTNVDDTMEFHVRCYKFVPTPAVDEHDWLTDFGSDYLLYQSLLESVDYVSAPEGRLIAWQQRASSAFGELTDMNTQFKISGPMALR